MYEYKAIVDRVIDGDTVDATVDLGFRLGVKLRFRIINYDAPETYRPKSEEERQLGKLATKKAEELLLNKEVILRTEPDPGIYGRWAAEIILDNGEIFSNIMINEGYVK